MAGSLPDVPDTRFDFAADGTRVFGTNRSLSNMWAEYTDQAALGSQLDGVHAVSVYANDYHVVSCLLMFPEPRTIRGLHWQVDRGGTAANLQSLSAEYSMDTVDGYGGTWTNFNVHGGAATTALPNTRYRTNIANVNVAGVRSIRLNVQITNLSAWIYFRNLHIYGSRSQLMDRVAFWHPTEDAELAGAYFDWGDVPRGSITATRPFRVKNLSATKAATDLQVVATGMTGSDFGNPGLQVSSDEIAWGLSTVPEPLAPGAITPVRYARLAIDPTIAIAARGGRLRTTMGAYA